MKTPWFSIVGEVDLVDPSPSLAKALDEPPRKKGSRPGVWDAAGLKERLRELHSTTRMSSTEISKILNAEFGLNLSRNAVIGKLTRLGLADSRPYKNKGSGNTSQRKGRKVGGSVPAVSAHGILGKFRKLPAGIMRPQPLPDIEGPLPQRDYSGAGQGGVTIQELNACTCRWPLGGFSAEPPFAYCGKTPLQGSPYCTEHAKIARNPNPRSW